MYYVDESMAHTGIPHTGSVPHSGRYKWGTGEKWDKAKVILGRNSDFLAQVDALRKAGLTDTEIAHAKQMSTTEFRARRSVERHAAAAAKAAQAADLRTKGWSYQAIADKVGYPNESSVRSALDPNRRARMDKATKIAEALKKTIPEDGAVDIGRYTELYLGTTSDQLKTAVQMLKDEGYVVRHLYTQQLGTGFNTDIKVLAAPDVTAASLYKDRSKVKTIAHQLDPDRAPESLAPLPPVSIDHNRVKVVYAEDGGKDRDGVILLRPSAEDLRLGNSHYAQVRVLVDKNHYLKGMAMYGDESDFPKGVDILFNTNKHKGTPMLSTKDKDGVLKKAKNDETGKVDPDSPFGATFKRQRFYIDQKTGKRKQSPINMVNNEGDWDEWSRSLPSQMLGKQPLGLIKRQLGIQRDRTALEYEEISRLTNPIVKRKMLQEFADSCDAASVHMKGAAMPRQRTQVILPIKSLKDNEIYAPYLKNGEHVVLIRFPHAGRFEIPELVVNNRNREAIKRLSKTPKDAVGINSHVAERMSGADFDGDNVLVIPNNYREVKSAHALAGLKNFDPSEAYPGYKGMKVMSPRAKQQEMGKISNLITDMTIRGASSDKIARAVRHSMVVIDAEKHKLNYKLSEQRNGIGALKEEFQGSSRAGASTLLSKATSTARVPERKLRSAKDGGPIDPKTGELVYVNTGKTYHKAIKDKKTGKVVGYSTREYPRLIKVPRMSLTRDARTLSSGTPVEEVYAGYANSMKALARKARKDLVRIKDPKRDPAAAKKYSRQVTSLKSKLRRSQMHEPLERKAQLVANQKYSIRKSSNPDLDDDGLKKLKNRCLREARSEVGVSKYKFRLTDDEWAAIQHRAVSANVLKQVLNYADDDQIKQLATPRAHTKMPAYAIGRAKGMLNRGFTWAEVADALGVSVTTLQNNLS